MADVLIKGMNLGDTKHGCPFTADDSCGGFYCVCGADCDGPFDQRTADCPVTVLPEHHGRLIDADALQEEFKKCHNGKRLMLIDTAPTIVPAKGGNADG